ncbi:MAG: DUF169 domain-containing protein [Sedimentisphaerales bacterium]|jgi:uncharacterized protein (DUF169 family)
MSNEQSTLNQICKTLSQMSHSSWVAVNFQERISSPAIAPMRFCEAVHEAQKNNVSLSPNNLCCDGARRCFGWLKNRDEELAQRLSPKTNTDQEVAYGLIKKVPVLNKNIVGISLGVDIRGDVYISYVNPESAMRIVRKWQQMTSENLRVDISGIMSVCGNVAVRSHLGQCISLSFGCPDSREYGGIEKGQLVMGLPYNIASKLLRYR